MRRKLQTESARYVASGSESAGAGQTQNELSREKERNTSMNPAPTRFNTIRERIKMKLIKEKIETKLITIAAVAAATAMIGFFCTVLIPLPGLLYPTLIICLIGVVALIADIFRR